MELYAGLDRSGTADLTETRSHQNYYVVCLAAVEDRDALSQALAELRQQLGMKSNYEFRGHDIGDNVQADFLRTVQTIGLYIGALIIDKAATRRMDTTAVLPSTNDFQVLTSKRLLRRFFALYAVADLRCDEDIKGKIRQQEFTTEVKRLYRACQPGERIHVRHCPSESNDLIQVADIVGYGLSRMARGVEIQPRLRTHLEEIRQEARNIIIGPQAWEIMESEQ